MARTSVIEVRKFSLDQALELNQALTRNGGASMDPAGIVKVAETFETLLLDKPEVTEHTPGVGETVAVVITGEDGSAMAYNGETYIKASMVDDDNMLRMPIPEIAPFGTPITKQGVREVWEAYVVPVQNSGKAQPIEFRSLTAILRHVYGAMPEEDS